MWDVRVERDRIIDLVDGSGLAESLQGGGANGFLAQTTTGTKDYPTTPLANYPIVPLALSGKQEEGESVSTSTDGDMMVATNVGSKVPPAGTQIWAHFCTGKLVFRYDGP